MYAPVGASYTRAKGLVGFGLAIPTHGHLSPGLQYFAVTRPVVSCLLLSDKVGAEMRYQRYWLPEKP